MAESNINIPNLYSEVQQVAATGSSISFVSDEQGNILLNIPVADKTSDSSQLDALLQIFNIIEVKPYLTSK